MKKLYTALAFIAISSAFAQTCTDPGMEPGDTGCVTFTYKNETVQYATVRAEDGNIWLQQNLGSSRVAESGTDTDAYGDFFQWGRWDDGHQNRDSQLTGTAPEPNNPLGLGEGSELFYGTDPEWWNSSASLSDTWSAATPQNVTETDGCDPCRALGDGWRLPTEAEWAAIIPLENMTTSIQSAFDSNLKLTAAGSRSYTGNINSAGIRGYYWSSTVSSTSFSKYLFFSNSTMNAHAGGFREQGSSVRCLKPGGTASAGSHSFIKPVLYPNPTTSIVTIHTEKQVQQAVVYTITGAEVYTGTGNVLNLEKLANGVYTIKIQLESGEQSTIKIIKQ